jgi:hypothetical protein
MCVAASNQRSASAANSNIVFSRVHTSSPTGVTQIVDFGGPKDFVAAAVTALENFEDGMIWLRHVVGYADGVLAMGSNG